MAIPIFLVFCTISLVAYAIIPMAYNRSIAFNQKRAHKFAHRLDRVMPRVQIKKVTRIYLVAPFALGALAFFMAPGGARLVAVVLGVIAGFLLPGIYIKILLNNNRKKFDEQLVDALMIMSSSFRGGLSLIQAMEAVVDEMPDPINQEFSTVLAENNMGVSLEEALAHLYSRMPSPALQQMTTAILLARETGGNLPAIFQRIVNVLRQRKRIEGQIKTLTIQGKIQGVVMSILPVAFFCVIYTSNPSYFQYMFESHNGRIMMVVACFLEVVGAFMIWRISALRQF